MKWLERLYWKYRVWRDVHYIKKFARLLKQR